MTALSSPDQSVTVTPVGKDELMTIRSKTAIVTGASSGIGAAAAQSLAESGFTVYAVARRADRLAALAGGTIHAAVADVTDDEALRALIDRVLTETGRIDVLVNNAGYGAYGALEHVSSADARAQVDVNLFALARLTQLVLPTMRAQAAGRIINVSSIGGKIYEPLGSWYHATKFAVEGMSDSLRVELRPFGIEVSVIEPGAVATEWGDGATMSLLSNSRDTVYAAQAAGLARVLRETARNPARAATPEAVADRIVAAATAQRPKTRYVVGRGARPLLALRHLLPDRAFDGIITRIFKPEPATTSRTGTAATST